METFDNICLCCIFRIPYTDHVTNATVRFRSGSPPQLSQLIQARRLPFFAHLSGMDLEHSKCQSEGCPKIADAHPDVFVIPGYTPWKQISNLLTLASSHHGNTLRIENTGSTSWKPLLSNSGHARDDHDNDVHTIQEAVATVERLACH